MSLANLKRIDLGVLAPATLLLTFLAHSWYGPDVFYHLAWGRDVVTHFSLTPLREPLLAQPVPTNPYWLFQATLFVVYSVGGIYLGSILFAAAWIAIARGWWSRVRAAEMPNLAPWLAVLAVIAVQTRFEQRPEVFSYLALTLIIGWCAELDLGRPLPRATLLKVALVQIAWTNAHGFFALGPLVAAARVFAHLVVEPRRDRPFWRRAAGLMILILLSSCASPFGRGPWRAVGAYAKLGPRLGDLIRELAPPVFSLASFPLAAFWISLGLTAAFGATALVRRRDWFAIFLAFGGSVLALGAIRNLPLLFIMSAPLWAIAAELPAWRRGVRVGRPLNVLACGSIAVAFVTGAYGNAIGYLGSFGVRLEPASYPLAATEYLAAKTFRGRLFNDSYDGGYLEYYLPEVEITGDSYFADVDRTREFFDAIRDPARLSALDARLRFDALLINIENLAVFEAVSASPAFTLVHYDSHRALFRRGTFDHVDGTYYGGEDLRHWANAFGPARWLAIASRRRDPVMLKRILSDLARAPVVPAAMIGAALTAAVGDARCPVRALAASLRARARGDDALTLPQLDELFARGGPCPP